MAEHHKRASDEDESEETDHTFKRIKEEACDAGAVIRCAVSAENRALCHSFEVVEKALHDASDKKKSPLKHPGREELPLVMAPTKMLEWTSSKVG